ncbi:MAG: AMP-binding protein [Armatimonadetes bacterium]|nr:AMP-binding protein [Armatimonadota bacterium]
MSFFLGIGIELLEGYGLSETSIIAINRPGKERVGTVGTLLPKAEVKIAEDGEILMRGQGRMKGYFRHAETTAEAINAEGWFHTGDIGELSADGYLKITDRKKDLLVLSNGKKVAPQPIEAELKHSDWIGEAVLFGDRQSTVSALIVPAFDKLLGWAKQNSIVGSAEELIENAEVQKIVKTEIDKVNATLPDYERIKRFRLLPKPFSIEAGELTPTLKVRRKVVAENYASILASFARD